MLRAQAWFRWFGAIAGAIGAVLVYGRIAPDAGGLPAAFAAASGFLLGYSGPVVALSLLWLATRTALFLVRASFLVAGSLMLLYLATYFLGS